MYYRLLLLIVVHAFVVCCYSKPANQSVTIQSCADIISYYQYAGYLVDDCYREVETNILFWRIDNPLSWQDARVACRSVLKADLAVPKTSAQRFVVSSLVATKHTVPSHTWIGINVQNETITYVDGSTVETYRIYPGSLAGNNYCGLAFFSWAYNNQAYVDDFYAGFYYGTIPCPIPYVLICQVPV